MSAIFNEAALTIASGQSLSGAVALGSGAPVAVRMPSSWTAAGLTFQASYDGATFLNLYDDGGTEVTAAVDASRHVALTPGLFAGAKFVKVRSGTAGSPVNQGAERSLTLITRRLNGE